jgi:formamidopyrimidine-DNA glycosylase
MPELPEVETVKIGLAKSLKNKKIKDFGCDWSKTINYPVKEFRSMILGLRVEAVERVAKMVVIKLTNGLNILIHLKMTGQLVFADKKDCVIGGHPIDEGFKCLPNKYTHAKFVFTNGSQLFFNDVRKFGWVRLFDDKELKDVIEKLDYGPEPLSFEFTFEYLKNRLKQRPNSKIKQFLLDPKNLVGVGNIYADEVCFFAKISPKRLSKTLKKSEIELIYKGIKEILLASIKAQGTTFRDYRNSSGEAGGFAKQLKVYGRHGQACLKCNEIINKIKIGGRTSSFCPKCQR